MEKKRRQKGPKAEKERENEERVTDGKERNETRGRTPDMKIPYEKNGDGMHANGAHGNDMYGDGMYGDEVCKKEMYGDAIFFLCCRSFARVRERLSPRSSKTLSEHNKTSTNIYKRH